MQNIVLFADAVQGQGGKMTMFSGSPKNVERQKERENLD